MWCRYNVCPNCSSARYQSPASRKNPQSPICYPSIPLPISDTRDHAVKATQALISSILVPVIPATCVPVGPVCPCGRLSRHGKRDMFSSKDMYLVERHIQERRNGQRTCNTVSEEERKKEEGRGAPTAVGMFNGADPKLRGGATYEETWTRLCFAQKKVRCEGRDRPNPR